MTLIGNVKDASLGIVAALYMTVDTALALPSHSIFKSMTDYRGAVFGETGGLTTIQG